MCVLTAPLSRPSPPPPRVFLFPETQQLKLGVQVKEELHASHFKSKLEMIKLSEEDMSKAELGQKVGQIVSLVVN